MGKDKWGRRNSVDNNMNDMWLYYKENYNKPVDKTTFVQVCYLLNKKIANSIITESFEFKMPFRLGKLRIKTNKQKIIIKDGKLDPNKMPINWVATKELWRSLYPELSWDKSWNILSDELTNIPNKQLVFHENDHSNGYINRWYWDKSLANTKNHTGYIFKPVKGGIVNGKYHYGKRGLAAWIKDDEKNNEYYE